ncbi:DUF6085 family protein [Streptomyces filamentosus]|uniref:Uncharacterized protein n=1 Tax=Streptomyces filamentosus TaxID=67294 RepID=A0A919BTV6_STRFL|nr:DUF6085 family protein [Streptomyces filamentosus]GHG15289.1 hypothetical protein GCM10017667_56020 [Streptomyces filamentosus]
MTPPDPNPAVQGRCPACRGTSLFLGTGGHVTCARIDCPNPCATDDLLHGQPASQCTTETPTKDRCIRPAQHAGPHTDAYAMHWEQT